MPTQQLDIVATSIPIRDKHYVFDYILTRCRELWPSAIAVNDSNEYFYGTQSVPEPGAYGYDIYRDAEEYVGRTIDCGKPIPYMNVRVDDTETLIHIMGDKDMVTFISKLALWKRYV